MTGLYMSNAELDTITAQKLIDLRPETVRIYPTIILKNTDLAILFESGRFVPMDIEQSVELAVKLEEMFVSNGIKVIRVGLHSIDETAYLAGPWHPAFRELCDSLRFRQRIEPNLHPGHKYEIFVSNNDVSKAVGHKKSNIKYFSDKNIKVKFIGSNDILLLNFEIKEVK
jgi:histone acetyltransferase (RNA polymerase elongator complex component)